jgi:hypothetical protein
MHLAAATVERTEAAQNVETATPATGDQRFRVPTLSRLKDGPDYVLVESFDVTRGHRVVHPRLTWGTSATKCSDQRDDDRRRPWPGKGLHALQGQVGGGGAEQVLRLVREQPSTRGAGVRKPCKQGEG